MALDISCWTSPRNPQCVRTFPPICNYTFGPRGEVLRWHMMICHTDLKVASFTPAHHYQYPWGQRVSSRPDDLQNQIAIPPSIGPLPHSQLLLVEALIMTTPPPRACAPAIATSYRPDCSETSTHASVQARCPACNPRPWSLSRCLLLCCTRRISIKVEMTKGVRGAGGETRGSGREGGTKDSQVSQIAAAR
jgi:hypothetical protein